MGKCILFAATKRDCSCRFWRKGDWRATSYVLYSDGTCYRMMRCVEEPQQSESYRMDANQFGRLKDLLENQFDAAADSRGCDGVQWEMHHYAPEGRHLHRFIGFIQGVSVLEEIIELLNKPGVALQHHPG